MYTDQLKQQYLDIRYNDTFIVVAIARTSKKVILSKMVYANKTHLNNWMGSDQLQYNITAGQYIKCIV